MPVQKLNAAAAKMQGQLFCYKKNVGNHLTIEYPNIM